MLDCFVDLGFCFDYILVFVGVVKLIKVDIICGFFWKCYKGLVIFVLILLKGGVEVYFIVYGYFWE